VDRPLLTDAMHVLRLLAAWLAFVLSWNMLEPTLYHLWYRVGGEQAQQQAPLPIDEPPQNWPGEFAQGCPAAEAANATSQPVPQPGPPAPSHAPTLKQREVLLDLSQAQATVTLRAQFDRCSPLLQQLRATMSGSTVLNARALNHIRETVFNSVNVGNALPSFKALQISVDDKAPDTVQVSTQAHFTDDELTGEETSYQVFVGNQGAWPAAATTIHIKVSADMGIWSDHPVPHAQTGTQVSWVNLPPEDAGLALNVTRADAPIQTMLRSTDPVARVAPTLIQAIRGQLAVLNPLWLGLGYGLPFVALLWWARRQATPGDLVAQALIRGCGLALLLLAGLTLAETVERLGWAAWQPALYDTGLPHPSRTTATAKIVFIALIWPTLAALWLQGKLVRPAAALGWTVGMLVVTGVSTLLTLVQLKELHRFNQLGLNFQVNPLSLSLSPQGAMTLVAALLVFGLSAWWLAIESVGFLRSASSFCKWVLGMVLAWLLSRWLTDAHEPMMAALLALPFGWAFARASVYWWPSGADGLSPGRRWLLSLLGALTMAWLTTPPVSPGHGTSAAWLLSSTAWAWAHLWQVAAVGLLVYWLTLHAAQARLARLPPSQQSAAWVFLLVVFYWRASSDWVPMLLALAIGWALTRYWVFAPRPLRLPTSSRPRMLHDALKVMSRHRELSSWQRDMQKGLSEQWAKGDATLTKAQNRSGELHRAIAASEYPDMRARALAQLALNVGSSAKANLAAWRGALMATLLSLPWITSYCVNVSRSGPPLTNAFAVSQLAFIVLDLLRWPALGYFLMYYYPHLRGRNGIEKGLCLAAALILPSLGATVLWNASDTDAWLSLLYWSLQVFICCMTIGVGLGDLGALRRAGKGPRSLKEIYKLSTLAAWLSSLALAAGGAATTLLVSQMGSLFSAGLKLLLPDTPPIGK